MISGTTPIRSVRDQIAGYIRAEILSGSIPRGEPVRERPLADHFGVSRGPIRDVFMLLTQEGLLTAEANCGVKVSEAPKEWMQPVIIETRRMIETRSVAHLINDMEPVDLMALEQIVEDLGEACRKGDMVTVTALDVEFHQALLELSGGADAVAIWRPLVIRMIMHYARHETMDQSYDEHIAILNAVRERDVEKASAALAANIQ